MAMSKEQVQAANDGLLARAEDAGMSVPGR